MPAATTATAAAAPTWAMRETERRRVGNTTGAGIGSSGARRRQLVNAAVSAWNAAHGAQRAVCARSIAVSSSESSSSRSSETQFRARSQLRGRSAIVDYDAGIRPGLAPILPAAA